jgi:L-arabonate dehydrase
MLYRNLASMDVEESIRGNPIDGVVLLMGCDKTTPSLLMGAASADLPTIGVSGGPMLNGKWRGQQLGSGTGVWSMSEQVRAGTLKLQDFFEAESCMHRSHGHCMTMGTASTMASMVEALGIGLPGNAASRRWTAAATCWRNAGRRIVEMVQPTRRMSKVLTREAFENAIRTLAAIGGSTNAVIHLIAIAGRAGRASSRSTTSTAWPASCPAWSTCSPQRRVPDGRLLLRRRPAGGDEGDRSCCTWTSSPPTARRWARTSPTPRTSTREVIKPLDKPFKANAGIAVLRGNLAPRGAVIKPSAATPALMQHTGRAVVFEDIDDFHARIDDDSLDVDETCILVLKNCGPKGYPGMAEVGNMPLPPKVLRRASPTWCASATPA